MSKGTTVRELISMLKAVDGDLFVYVRGYEDGVDDVGAVTPIRVVRDVWLDTWYYGDHEVPYGETDKDTLQGVQLVPAEGTTS